ncbi:MAG TPA: prolipoprotein diacylglyceryl transferase [Turneriella sp.]|nr:prolipoprotein diacylglyceryl transferase [Turneriella sp.]HNA78061.1 prolipoprotein diacylglyceryl transferase [Turneriella sp.]HNE18605.1 prolipoprotein diacylglyceryl transferase [Turneriella sp.]HNJ64897.1 prolipoprotein diacylglyceryl transferase [Turneriella sp.]HNL09133.1 prolipoprotein diacylglyceryl transferase [Turneriella sp.]
MVKYLKYLLPFALAVVAGCTYREGMLKSTIVSWAQVSPYGITMALAFYSAFLLIEREFPRVGLKVQLGDYILLAGVVGGIVGAKIAYVIEIRNTPEFQQGSLFSHLFSGAGLTWYGGFILASAAIIFILWKNKVNILFGIDTLAPMLALGYVFGRAGCIFSGDGCYGGLCTMNWPAPFCMAFPNGAASWSEWLARYANGNAAATAINTPFFESAFSFLCFLFLWGVRKKQWPLGSKFFLYLFLHALFRFSIEFIRLNPRDVFGVSQAQFLSLLLMAISAGYVIVAFTRRSLVAPR